MEVRCLQIYRFIHLYIPFVYFCENCRSPESTKFKKRIKAGQVYATGIAQNSQHRYFQISIRDTAHTYTHTLSHNLTTGGAGYINIETFTQLLAETCDVTMAGELQLYLSAQPKQDLPRHQKNKYDKMQ